MILMTWMKFTDPYKLCFNSEAYYSYHVILTIHCRWINNLQIPNKIWTPPQWGITSASVHAYMLQDEEVEECLNSILNHVYVCTNVCMCCFHYNIHCWVDRGEFRQTVQLPYWNVSTHVQVQPVSINMLQYRDQHHAEMLTVIAGLRESRSRWTPVTQLCSLS